eukprot:211641-Hanusia_phi.AAC.2
MIGPRSTGRDAVFNRVCKLPGPMRPVYPRRDNKVSVSGRWMGGWTGVEGPREGAGNSGTIGEVLDDSNCLSSDRRTERDSDTQP